MLLQPRKFKIEGDFLTSARAAIVAANEEFGYPPNEVWVTPETDTGGNTFVAVGIGDQVHQIVIVVRPDLRIGFSLADDEALLQVNDPNSVLESAPLPGNEE